MIRNDSVFCSRVISGTLTCPEEKANKQNPNENVATEANNRIRTLPDRMGTIAVESRDASLENNDRLHMRFSPLFLGDPMMLRFVRLTEKSASTR